MEKEIDILIIGGNLSGLLTSYIFYEKNINCVLIEKEKINNLINKQIESYKIDNEQTKLISLVTPSKKFAFFKMTLEGIYKLHDIVNHLDNDCDFYRNPIIKFKPRKKNNDNILKFPFIYKLGAFINLKKLMIELLNYHKKNNISFYENCSIKNMEITHDNVLISLNNNIIYKCKKILVCDYDVSKLYFDLPKKYEIKESYTFLNKNINNNIYTDRIESIAECKYYMCPMIEYNVTSFLYETKLEIPYTQIHAQYSQVYFNVTNNILSSIIGAISLRNKFLESKNIDLKII